MSEDLTAVLVEDRGSYEVYDITESGAVVNRVELAKPQQPGFRLFLRRLPSGSLEFGWELPAA